MVSSLGLTHPLAAAQAGGFLPRRWLPGFCGRARLLRTSRWSLGVGLWGWMRGPACVHTCAGT